MRERSRLLLIAILILAFTALVGCSSGGSASSGDRSADSAQAEEEPRSVLAGTISGITDGVFTVTDQDGIPYDFPYEGEEPEGLGDASEGDYVKVTYTGDLSETDGFDGEVVSVETQ